MTKEELVRRNELSVALLLFGEEAANGDLRLLGSAFAQSLIAVMRMAGASKALMCEALDGLKRDVIADIPVKS